LHQLKVSIAPLSISLLVSMAQINGIQFRHIYLYNFYIHVHVPGTEIDSGAIDTFNWCKWVLSKGGSRGEEGRTPPKIGKNMIF
jgi:hypothetical protein